AQKYTHNGYVVWPVTVTRNDQGRKQLSTPPWRDATATPDDWGEHTGLAVLTGPSGLVVVDIDYGDGQDSYASLKRNNINLPYTPMVFRTPSGREHRYYRAPQGVTVPTTASELALDVDIRADGGMALAPPTEGYDNKGRAVPVSELPEFPAALVPPKRERGRVVIEVDPAELTPRQRQ